MGPVQSLYDGISYTALENDQGSCNFNTKQQH